MEDGYESEQVDGQSRVYPIHHTEDHTDELCDKCRERGKMSDIKGIGDRDAVEEYHRNIRRVEHGLTAIMVVLLVTSVTFYLLGWVVGAVLIGFPAIPIALRKVSLWVHRHLSPDDWD
jgi:hypothetical protein